MAIIFALTILFIYSVSCFTSIVSFFVVAGLMSKEEPPKWYDEFVVICGIVAGFFAFFGVQGFLTKVIFS